MGCSCKNKPAMRNTMPRQGVRPVVGGNTRSVQGGVTAGPSPMQVRAAAAAATNNAPTQQRSPAGMNAERRATEQKRRDAIRNALGRS
jgi:hypothetical protein